MKNKLSRWFVWIGAVGLCLMGVAAQVAHVRSVGWAGDDIQALVSFVLANAAGGVLAVAFSKRTDERVWPNAFVAALVWLFAVSMTHVVDVVAWMGGHLDIGEVIWFVRREMSFVFDMSRFFGGVTVALPPNCIPDPVGVSALTTGVRAYGLVFAAVCGILAGLLLWGICLTGGNGKARDVRWPSALIAFAIAIPFALSFMACLGCPLSFPLTTPFVGSGYFHVILSWFGVGLVLNNLSHTLGQRTDNGKVWRLIFVSLLLSVISWLCRWGCHDLFEDFHPVIYRFEKRVKSFAESADECRLVSEVVTDPYGRVRMMRKRLVGPTFDVPVDFPDSWLRAKTNGKENGNECDDR